jgi:hypothetical protein
MAAPNEALCGPSSAALNVGFTWSFIGTTTARDYPILLKAPYAFRITETTAKGASGSAAATVKIDTVALGGSAHTVTSTEETFARTSSNVVSRDTDVIVTFAAGSVDPQITIKGQRI